MGCKYDGEYEGAVVCDPTTVKKAASGCPADYYIVLVDVNGVTNFFDHLRSSAWRGVASLNTADDPLVFPHEFAHLFADLYDEYTWEGGKITGDSRNCDPEFDACPSFDVVEGSECHAGCVNYEHARSIGTGIMRDYWKSSSYGVFNEYLIEQVIFDNTLSNKQIGTVSLSPKGNPVQEKEEVLVVEYECAGKDCEISSVSEGNGYVQKYLDSGSENVFSLGLSNGASYKFDGLDLLYIEGHNLDGEMEADHRVVSRVNDFVVLEKPEQDVRIDLRDPSGKILDSHNYVFTSDGDSYVPRLNSKIVDIDEVV